jgi:hypothetical protein
MTDSGADPMDRPAQAADAADAMKTATRYHQETSRRGRFGRDVREAPATDGAQTTEAGTTTLTDRPDGRYSLGVYMIDANAVAEAILTRLIAGRTLPPPRDSVLEPAPARRT